MRGEELQLLGWLASHEDESQSDPLFCLAGTHAKWCRIEDDKLETFGTSITGELFALISEHSILVRNDAATPGQLFDQNSFHAGVDLCLNQPNALLHKLFSTRARKLTSPDAAEDCPSYLSGLLIGSCIQNAFDLFGVPSGGVKLVRDPSLCKHYAYVIERLGRNCRMLDGVHAIHAGFLAL